MQREIWLNILQICNYKQSFLVRVPSLLVVKTIHFLVFNQRIFTFEDFWFLYITQGSSWCKKFFLDRNWSRSDTRSSTLIMKGTIADFQTFLLVNAHLESIIVSRELSDSPHPLLQPTLFPPLNWLPSLQFWSTIPLLSTPSPAVLKPTKYI